MHKPKVMLVVMDGWGYSSVLKGNAIAAAKTPTFNYFWQNFQHTFLASFGESVGLPWGATGSSEVGHTSIGTGRLVHQELALIDKEIATGDFAKNKAIVELISYCKQNKKPLHLIGLLGDGGVHSQQEHLYEILKTCRDNDFKSDIYIHAIVDGRDTAPESALLYIKDLEKKIAKYDLDARIASVSGRYYAMDRDSRWDRTKKFYQTITENLGKPMPSAEKVVEASYAAKVSDEFLVPKQIDVSMPVGGMLKKIFAGKAASDPVKVISEGDGVFYFNIRPDRMRQITEMMFFPKKDIGTDIVKNLKVVTLTTYNEFLPVTVAYPEQKAQIPLAKILSDNNVAQGHFAETEKYAHVTYFFDGGNPTAWPKESWNLVPSPKVATYDQKPEMSADEITAKVMEIVEKEQLEFVLINYANVDMVAHTGVFDKVVIAAETVDRQLNKLARAYMPETTLIITADHGNGEQMVHPETGEIDKKHSVNPIPFILVGPKYLLSSAVKDTAVPSGILADIAPTILEIFNLPKSPEMNGISLINSFGKM